MRKMKKYAVGGGIETASPEEIQKYKDQYAGPKRKPLPSETIKEDKRAKDLNEDVKDSIMGGPQGVISALARRLKNNVMGSDEQNAAAEAREKARARANPEGNEAKFRRMMGEEYKAGGKVSSASKRADGCAQRGKTRGKMV